MNIKLEGHDWKKYPIINAGIMVGKVYKCTHCSKKVEGFKDSESAREFKISGWCQECQDIMFFDKGEEV